MKIYKTLSQAASAFKRRPREVFAILSLNGNAYFVFRSNPSAEMATKIQAFNKMKVHNELVGEGDKGGIDQGRIERLFKFMVSAGVPSLFPERGQHAEENLIRNFSRSVEKYKAAFPRQKIQTIDVFLSHSPCQEKGVHNASSQCTINGFFLPIGCDQKLTTFFKSKHYQSVDKNSFSDKTKVRVRYNFTFDASVNNENDLVSEADPELKFALNKYMENK
ncbi:hypothetical protein [Legionella jamestowniensis]|uniref:Uncharacterized protein n=1 Tax=Legionella jamestowniensis TaxID=455 RepID=A0A0W0UJ26_9GAMM|nr:hypothetical protein [Legionella jamestowniensis]KTD07724.1 hypothetical protein Ljam_1919 [Legionella jamestowniensis]SFL61233.1 hypothetical protein SAMN02746073_1039 [Legionella jamestowniensis DSM 19215]